MVDRSERVAIITGASRGVGAALVDAYRREGFQVIANSRSLTRSDHLEVFPVAGDIADPATTKRIADEAIARFGRIDTLINNAGVCLAKPFSAYTHRDYELITSVNARGVLDITHRTICRMLEQDGGGHIINVTAAAAALGQSALTAFTRGGLVAVTRSLAIECTGQGIRVNAIVPGAMAEAADIVHGALYLENASAVTGEILHIDGATLTKGIM